MSKPEFTVEKQRPTHLFKPGVSGNPAGRPKGARSKLGGAFLEDLHDVWNEHGTEALRRCAEEDPGQFCRIVASLMPKEATLDLNMSVFADVRGVVEAYRLAADLLGTNPQRGLRRLQQIEHEEQRDVFTQRR